MRELCGLLGYTSQAYYQQLKKVEVRTFKQEELMQRVIEHRQLQPRLGTRKLLGLLHAQGFIIGRDALFELLRDQGLLIRRPRRRVRTTFSCHRFRKYADLASGLVPERSEQLWVSDITYISVNDRFAYLSLVTDAYSRKIIGFCVSHDLSTDTCLSALRMALASRKTSLPLIHHSDRGVQYCSMAYTKLLNSKGISISMTQGGDPRDNAIAERVNGILKQELLKNTYETLDAAYRAVKQAIPTYNRLRPHSSLDMLTPEQAHLKTGSIKRRWRNYYPKPDETINQFQD